jgi:hypothetical protein
MLTVLRPVADCAGTVQQGSALCGVALDAESVCSSACVTGVGEQCKWVGLLCLMSQTIELFEGNNAIVWVKKPN